MSRKYSLDGWNLKDFITGNYKPLKEILKVVIPLAVTWSLTNSPELTGLFTIGGKALLDILEYYFKEQ